MASFTSENAKGAVAVITGGSAGIGLAVAEELAKLGAKAVVITGRSQERIDKALKKLEAGGYATKFSGKSVDAVSWDDNVALFKFVSETYGSIDYVFANATGQNDAPSNPPDFSQSVKPTSNNLFQLVDSIKYTIHASTPYLVNGTRDKAIIITGSEVSFCAMDANIDYALGKATINQIVYSYRDFLKAQKIRINVLAPGYVKTDLSAQAQSLLPDHHFIPIEKVVAGYIGLVQDSFKTGAVRRIRDANTAPIDYESEHRDDTKLAYFMKLMSAAPKSS